MFKYVTILSLMGCLALAAPAQNTGEQGSLLDEAFQVYHSCSEADDISVCLKLKALKFVDRAARSAEINVADGLKIVQTDEAKKSSRAENARSLNDIEASLPAEVDAKEAAVDDAILDRTAKFLSTHTVEFSFPEESSSGRSLSEARGKKKKIVKSLLPILLLLKLKLAAIIPIVLGALALIAFKALIAGKLALIISLVLGLQKLLGSKHQSYEVVAHPVSHGYGGGHDEHHDHGWARSSGSELAYKAHKPASN